MKDKLILIGGGGHCHACIDVIESTSTFEIIGIIDTKDKIGQSVLGYPIIGKDSDLSIFIETIPSYRMGNAFTQYTRK